MKKSLLATVAAIAVIAGPALAQKLNAPPSDVTQSAPPPPAVQNAPAEKIAPPMSTPSTTGQATPGNAPDIKGGADVKSGSETRSGADVKGGADTRTQNRTGADGKTQAGTDAKPGPNTAQGKNGARGGGNVALTTEQKTKIRSSVLTSRAPRVTNVNFSVRVGTVVPRTVRVVAVPAPLIEVHPAWRGKMYFVYNDQIVIVEPDTMEIITVIMV